jgi:hypothetical protein
MAHQNWRLPAPKSEMDAPRTLHPPLRCRERVKPPNPLALAGARTFDLVAMSKRITEYKSQARTHIYCDFGQQAALDFRHHCGIG